MRGKADPMSTIYVVEARGTLDSGWGYYDTFFRTQRAAREDIKRRKTQDWPCEQYRIIRYMRFGRVR